MKTKKENEPLQIIGCKLVEEKDSHTITNPYNVVTSIRGTRSDLWVLDKWISYFKIKEVPNSFLGVLQRAFTLLFYKF